MIRDRPVFDVSLVVGHRDWLKSRSEFSKRFVRRLDELSRQAKREIPSLQTTLPGRLHFTLRAVFGARARSFPRKSSKDMRLKRYAQVREWVRGLTDRRIVWRACAVTSDDVLILQGRALGNWLTHLRRKIDKTSDVSSPYPPSNFCHVVLAHPSRPLRHSEKRRLRSWVRTQGRLEPIRMSIKRPILLATRNHFGTQYDRSVQREVEKVSFL